MDMVFFLVVKVMGEESLLWGPTDLKQVKMTRFQVESSQGPRGLSNFE